MKTVKGLSAIVLSTVQVKPLFELFKANMLRTRQPFTIVLLSVYESDLYNEQEQKLIQRPLQYELQSIMRQTDILFTLNQPLEWGIFLAHSTEREAEAFIERLIARITEQQAHQTHQIEFALSMIELRDEEALFEEVLLVGQEALKQSKSTAPWHIEYVNAYKHKNVETVKVSVVDDHHLTREIIKMALERMKQKQFYLKVETFSDGYEFIESNWYRSSHSHIMLINDVLPRKTGLEVIKTLRSLPNNQRFMIFMMTKRESEEDMIGAYESGVDHYLIKPFNLRLLEAQLKRVLVRL